MCGIAGIIAYDDASTERCARVLAMRDRLIHRGPDGVGLSHLQYATLGHTRLALLDAAGGAQPMQSPEGRFTVVYNGEIYNLKELRDELRDTWAFQTRSDCEVLLAAFATWGPQCLPRLNGMFAFFIWDAHLQHGFAARDLLGVKPLVYAFDGRELIFASEAKAVLAAHPKSPRANIEAVLEYFTAPSMSGVASTPFEDLHTLAPGHALTIDRDGVRVDRWGDFKLGESSTDQAASPRQLRYAIEAAVERAMTADVPVGAFLSGGLDSTLLASIAQRKVPEIRCFTIDFADQSRFDYARARIVISDDTPFAVSFARERELQHTLVNVQREDLAGDLGTIAMHNDALVAWEQELSQHHLARAASKHVKALLVGDAADETHYGYHFLLDAEATQSPAYILRRFSNPPIRKALLADPISHFDEVYRTHLNARGHRWAHPIDRQFATARLILDRWLPRLLHNGDIHTMSHSLEARVPFADREVINVAERVHPDRALHGGVEKSFLRSAALGLVPEEIRTRRKSALPIDQNAGEVYRAESKRAIAERGDVLSAVLDLDRLNVIVNTTHVLSEQDRALLFRVVCFTHWADHYKVRFS